MTVHAAAASARTGRQAGAGIFLLGLCLAWPVAATADAVAPSLIWHVETTDGEAVDSRGADRFVNPASLVKVGTSLWALERLGPRFRFQTRFLAAGEWQPGEELLAGDLRVEGGGDPDFHPENALLVAVALNERGLRGVQGRLLVDEKFWIGWENGSEGQVKSAAARARDMAERLRRAWDPGSWDGPTREAWIELARRRGLPASPPPSLRIEGGVGAATSGDAATGVAAVAATRAPESLLVSHTSGELVQILRRFNCYSNNDIERLEAVLGSASDLVAWLARRLDIPLDEIELSTTSGLGRNRLTLRGIVRLLREFRTAVADLGLTVESVLPVAGCDPGTLDSFPRLLDESMSRRVAGKTGTLTRTDGGIVLLGGFFSVAGGDRVFCVAAPEARGRIESARRQEERWLVRLLSRSGNVEPRSCAPPLPLSDYGAVVVFESDRAVHREASRQETHAGQQRGAGGGSPQAQAE